MKRWLLPLALLMALALPRSAQADQITPGDTTVTSGITFKVYPLFTLGGGHMHAPQWVGDPNNNWQCASKGGFVYSSGAIAYVNIYRNFVDGQPSDRDTTRVLIPAGGSFTRIPECDSLQVILTGATTFSWGLFR